MDKSAVTQINVDIRKAIYLYNYAELIFFKPRIWRIGWYLPIADRVESKSSPW